MGPRGLARQSWRALCGTLAQHPPHPRAAENATSCRISCMTRILRAPSSSLQRSRIAEAFLISTHFFTYHFATSSLILNGKFHSLQKNRQGNSPGGFHYLSYNDIDQLSWNGDDFAYLLAFCRLLDVLVGECRFFQLFFRDVFCDR